MSDRMLAALAEARRLGNLTVRDTHEIAANHREIDALLTGTVFDDPKERYDAPDRVANRDWMDKWFQMARSAGR